MLMRSLQINSAPPRIVRLAVGKCTQRRNQSKRFARDLNPAHRPRVSFWLSRDSVCRDALCCGR